MAVVKHSIKLTDVSKEHATVGSHHHVLKAEVAHAQHRHVVRLDAFVNPDGLHVFVGEQMVATMMPDQKAAAGLRGFTAQEVQDAVEDFLGKE